MTRKPPKAKKKRTTKKGAPTRKNAESVSPKKTTKPAAKPRVPLDERPNVPIVGIGTSAGGLDALEQFFTNMPADTGMAFVLVQHLDPTHKSILRDLVKRYTRMQVFEVEDGMKVEPNCAYIIPPNRDMAILHGTLELIEPTAPRGLRLPIDFFFRSFAQDKQEQAICIVLSGTGTDGTLGLKAVKEEGGLVMVQDPASAKYDGMPKSAIATGLVDFVLPADKMLEQLLRYVDRAFAAGREQRISSPLPKSPDEFKKIFVLLRAHTGHDFSFYKPNSILRRIDRRMTVNQIDRLDEYVGYLQHNSLEVEALFKELLIGVSNFFRDSQAFAAMEKKVIPVMIAERNLEQPLRVWVPGCSTGEEAYSIAILLREQMERLKQDFNVQIFATDIDSTAIEWARTGVYPHSIAVDVSEGRLHRFFTKHENTYQVAKSIRDTLVFAEQNVVKDPPFSRLDLISCRNLLIYMGGELQKRLFPLFHYALREDGYLFLGTSESIGEATDLFRVVDRKWKLYQRNRAAATPKGADPRPLPMPHDIHGRHSELAVKQPARMNARELAEGILLNDYAPPSVLINEKGEGLYFHGRTGKYLEPPTGDASWNIVGMARQGLRFELTAAIRKAVRQKKAVRYENIPVKTNGENQNINLTVTPVSEDADQPRMLLVVFEDIAPQEPAAVAEPIEQGDVELERELRSTKQYLQTTIEELETSNEELKSTNEELQSANEELQSTNEELETSKEELQSINEELVTVNTEHEVRLVELTTANNDISNLLASTDIGTLFLDMNLHIQQFTPSATSVIKLIQTDVGRPMSDIASNLIYDRLVEDVKEVLDTLVPKDVEVQTKAGLWYSMRVRPYRTTENVIEGAVVSFVNVTEQKQVEEALRVSERRFRELVEKAAVIPWEADASTWRFTYVGPQALDILGYRQEDWYQDNFWAEHIHPDDRSWVLDYCERNSVSSDNYEFEYRVLSARGDAVWLRDVVNVVNDAEGDPKLLRGYMFDITARKRVEDALNTLHQMNTVHDLPLEEKLKALLKLGCRLLMLPIGIVSHVRGESYEVVQAVTPDDALKAGDKFELGKTYCSETIQAEQPIGFEHAGASEWRIHPCYREMRLEAYLGLRVLVGEETYGTLNFSSLEPRKVQFANTDKEILKLMAQWVASELAR